MKTLFKRSGYILALLLLAPIFMAFYGSKNDKCQKNEMGMEAVDRLKKFTLIQQFPFYMKEKKKKDAPELQKQVVTLNRGVRYKFYTVRNSEYEGLPIITIYNNEKLEFLVATTYNANLKKFYNELEFECKSTGNYCMTFSFQDGLEGCALGVFSSLIKE